MGQNQSCADVSMCNWDLEVLLYHTGTPIESKGNSYYLSVNKNISWSDFVSLLGPQAADWADCDQCSRTWDVVSTLSDERGYPILLGDNLETYPEFSHLAITTFKELFAA